MKTNHDKILGKRQQAIKNAFSHIRIPGQSKTFLKFIKSPGHLSNSGVFQDFTGLASQFFRATTGIQPSQTNFEESRSIMTSLTKSRVTEILCSLILILERKEGEQILSRLEFVKEISASISQM